MSLLILFTLLFAKRILILVLLLIISSWSFAAEKKWTGLATDNKWSSADNWSDHLLPLPGDDVVFDNTLVANNYAVTISGQDSLLVHSITLTPAAGNVISLTIDTTSVRQVALTLSSMGYSMTINNGGTVVNASRVTEGAVITLSDSLRINNGGLYSHQTRRPHAAIVAKLSHAAGTEHGTFAFDLPSGTGTLSLSNRIYGNLVLSASNAGGARTYSGTGANPLTINGDLTINNGVNFSIDLGGVNGNVIVKGNFIQNSGVLNIASGATNTTIFKIAGDITQSPGGQVTESKSGLPSLELNGTAIQRVSLAGTISNNVSFRVNNPAGILLQSPLSLPYKLELVNGMITTTSASLLTLQTGCAIQADSTATTNFINGPLRKEGLSATDHFLFPVGKAPALCWLELKNATGNFIVEYIKADPRQLNNNYGAGIDHISATDYWIVNADAGPAPLANTVLSFVNGGNHGITDMSTLRIAQLSAATWTDRGNTAIAGSAGASGSITSNPVTSFGPAAGYFALAASVPNQNPLPVKLLNFSAAIKNDNVLLDWLVDLPKDSIYFMVLESGDNKHFDSVGRVDARSFVTRYNFLKEHSYGLVNYYKLRIIEKNGDDYFSKVVSVRRSEPLFGLHFHSASVVRSKLDITLSTPQTDKVELILVSADGRIMWHQVKTIQLGDTMQSIDISQLPAGAYFLYGKNNRQQTNVLRFIKQ